MRGYPRALRPTLSSLVGEEQTGMLNVRPRLVTILILFGLSLVGALPRTAKPKAAEQNNGATNDQSSQQSGSAEVVRVIPQGRPGEMKVLAEGSYGQVGEPFIAVTRDPQVYAALRRSAQELPVLSDEFFKSYTVVAVFTGLRNTGGHAIEMTRTEDGRLLVSERVPPPEMMTTQAMTKPFKVVGVPAKENENVSLVLQGGLAASMLRPYRVTSGEFMAGEDRAVRAERFGLEGELRVARFEGLATVFFDVRGVGAKASNVLQTAATGIVETGGRFSLMSLDAKTPDRQASRRLRATGQFTGGDENKLALDFASPASKVAGGFSRAGKLAAVATAPAPAKGQPDASMY